MILDRPKRRAETMVGTVKLHHQEVEGATKQTLRWQRAFEEVCKKHELTGTTRWLGDCEIGRYCPTTITAIIHREPLESRWARALDMIREQYGLEIEWERGEVTEKVMQPSDTFVKWAEEFADRVAKGAGIPREVLLAPLDSEYVKVVWEDRGTSLSAQGIVKDLQEASRLNDGFRYKALSAGFKSEEVDPLKKLQAYSNFDVVEAASARGPYKGAIHTISIGGIKLLPPGEEIVPLKELLPPWLQELEDYEGDLTTATRITKDLFNVLRSCESVIAVRGVEYVVSATWQDSLGGCFVRFNHFNRVPRAVGYRLPDTPTGTAAWDEETGGLLEKEVDRSGSITRSFFTSFHLEVKDSPYCDIRCPICGNCSLTDSYLTGPSYLNLFEGDNYNGEIMSGLAEGVTCDECDNHLTYDFEKEMITIKKNLREMQNKICKV